MYTLLVLCMKLIGDEQSKLTKAFTADVIVSGLDVRGRWLQLLLLDVLQSSVCPVFRIGLSSCQEK